MRSDSSSLSPDDLHFARIVVEQGLCGQDKIDECVGFISRLLAQGVTPVPRLAELLVRKGYLTPEDATLRPAPSGRTPEVDPRLPPDVALAAEAPGRRLGRYVQVTRLGAGGMGEVWKGWDRDLGRWVALKFLRRSDPDQEARLRREAQTAAALNHPHIASVYEVGMGSGTPFIAMQYIEGQTLATFPRQDRRVLVELLRDASLAVDHAHGQGVIHRDLKPANLMVERGRVFVMDFGLAKAMAVDSSLSVSGSIVGTPAYMSPEQARGRAAEISRRSDIYSLGATLYELLTDRPPFVDEEVYALLRKVVDQDPLPLRRLRASIDRDLETIVLKCLDKEPARRYRTARDLADDLDRWLRGEPILAHPPSPFYQARKFIGRKKALVGMGAAGLVSLAVALGILVPSWRHERSLKELAPLRTQIAVVREWVRQPFRKPEELRRALNAEIDAVSTYIERHPGVPQGHFVRAQARLYLGDLRAAEQDAREAIRLDPAFLPAWTLLGRIQLEVYAGLLTVEPVDPFKVREDLARRVLEEARESLRRGGGSRDSRSEVETWGLARTRDDAVGSVLVEALRLWYVQGSREEAVATLNEAHRRAPSEEYLLWTARWLPWGPEKEKRIRETMEMAPHDALGHVEWGNWLIRAGRHAEAVQSFGQAITLDPTCAAAFVGRGIARAGNRDYAGAIEDFSQALRLDRQDTSAYIYRSAARSMAGDHDGAIADADLALQVHPDSVGALINRSIARRGRKDYRGALDDLARVRALKPGIPHPWANQAGVRLEMKDPQGALEDLSRALAIDGSFVEAYLLRGALRQRSDPDASIGDFTRALELMPAPGRADLRADITAERCLSRLYKGDLPGAVADAQEALRLHPDGFKPLLQNGNVLLAAGNAEGALRYYDQAVRRDSRVSEAWTARSQALLGLQRFAEAAADASRALELSSDNYAAFMVRAVARQNQKDYSGAERDCTKVTEFQPDSPYAFFVRSHCRAALGRFPEAADDAEQAFRLYPPGAPQKEQARKAAAAFRFGKTP